MRAVEAMARGCLLVTEVFGLPGTSGPTGQPASVAALVGPTYQVHAWLALDLGVIVPLTGPQPHAFYAGGVVNAERH